MEVKDDAVFMETFIRQSVEDLENYLSCVKDAVKGRNLPWLLFISHKSKALLELLGDTHVKRMIESIAELGASEQWEMEELLDGLDVEIKELIVSINSELKPQEV